MLERCYEIAKTNWKHNLCPHFIVAALLCMCSPLLMGVKNLDEMQVARIIVLYLCFLGVILLIPIFLPDTNKDIRDLIASKSMEITTVRVIRLLESVICLVMLILLYLAALKKGNCEFRYGVCVYIAISSCMFLGALGMLFYSIIDNIAVAYMIPFLYYLVSTGSGDKYLGVFSLMISGEEDLENRIYLLIAGIFMLALSLLIRQMRRN